MKAIFLDAGSIPERIYYQRPDCITQWSPYQTTTPEQCLPRCLGADIILTNKVVLTADIIKQLDQTKLICITATGTNNVDLLACKKSGIAVVNATDYCSHSVAEHVLMLMLSLSRSLPIFQRANQEKSWSQSQFSGDIKAPIHQLYGKTVTIVGAGTLGSAVADRCRAFGMKVIFADRQGRTDIRTGYTEFTKAIAKADFISINCPLTEQTYNLFNKEVLALCQPDAIIINASRGGIVNEKDLLNALQSNQLGGAGLDVAVAEPPKLTDMIWALNELENVIITPHIAWAADEALQILMDQIMNKIARFYAGENIGNLCDNL